MNVYINSNLPAGYISIPALVTKLNLSSAFFFRLPFLLQPANVWLTSFSYTYQKKKQPEANKCPQLEKLVAYANPSQV